MQQPGPHGGAGTTTAYPFFRDAPTLGFELRKRVLHKGAGIGLHQHRKDEIYYVLGGAACMSWMAPRKRCRPATPC